MDYPIGPTLSTIVNDLAKRVKVLEDKLSKKQFILYVVDIDFVIN